MTLDTISANPLKQDLWSHRKAIFICAVAMLSSFQYGLDYALVGGFLSMPGFLEVFGYFDKPLKRYNIDPTVQQLISSIMTVGTFISPLLVGPFSSKFGRKVGLWSATILIYVAAILQIATTSKGVLYFGRLLMGWLITFAQLYAHEAAPAHLRGIVLAIYQIFLSTGGIIGYAVDYGTRMNRTRHAYQIPLSIFFVVPTLQAILLSFVAPESPRWLMGMKRDGTAEQSLRRLRHKTIAEAELQAELNEIRQSTREQLEHNKSSWLFVEMWRGTNRRRTLLSIATVSFHAANGSSWINIYTTYFLQQADVDNPLAYSILVAAIGLIGVLVSLAFVRHWDRRIILLVGVLGCGISQLILAVVWTAQPGTKSSSKVVVAFICLFEFFFVAYSPYSWLVGGELPNNQLRAFTLGVATAVNFLGNWAGTFSAPYFINPAEFAWGPRYGYIWFGSNIICAMFIYFLLPETKDRTLEEIHEMFEARLHAGKFKGHVCVSTHRAAEEATVAEKTGEVGEVRHVEEVRK